MAYFNIVAQTSENTVVTEYEPVKARSDSYQSEAALEKEFIRLLCEQGYEYLQIHSEKDLITNLRHRLEKLNSYEFSDSEWKQFFSNSVANPNEHIVEKTRKIQEDFVQVLKRDDGTSKNIKLIDKGNIHNNFLQVINQYVIGKEDGAKYDNRYDVTVLVNGLPVVHIELKRRGVAIREAFNQIDRYQRDSFWAGCGLFEYVQMFVISNGTNTKYYSISICSDVKIQYLVKIFNMVCFAKKVFVKSIKSVITRLLASAQKQVNSKLLLVFPFFVLPEAASFMALKRVLLE